RPTDAPISVVILHTPFLDVHLVYPDRPDPQSVPTRRSSDLDPLPGAHTRGAHRGHTPGAHTGSAARRGGEKKHASMLACFPPPCHAHRVRTACRDPRTTHRITAVSAPPCPCPEGSASCPIRRL